jgi:hypothetical protein
MPSFMYWTDQAIKRFDEIWPILGMRDMTAVEDMVDKMAFNKHVELLKKNWPDALYGRRVKTHVAIKRDYMQGFNIFHAAAIAKILGTIKEGETIRYMNIVFQKCKGKLSYEKEAK